ncbi:MAG: low temperature requirement protein A [Acidimicrobiia bacterium]
MTEESAVDEAAEERHATNLELFLDLVFVFAVTQLAVLIGEHVTVHGTLAGVLVAFLVWWQWSQYTWAGAAMNLQDNPVSRVLVLCTIPVTLLMTIAIPDAFGRSGVWFGWAYCGVQVLVISMQGALTARSPEQRRAFARYASVAMLSPAVILVGAYLEGDARVWVWVGAAGLNLVAAVRGGTGEWTINATHFAERHALFVIIALGEVVVAAGATAYGLSHAAGLTADLVTAMGVAVALACLFWWTYFAYVPAVGERALGALTPVHRGVLARDFFTLGHFPLVTGIVLYSVVVEHLLRHPTAALGAADRWLLAISVLLFTGGLLVLRFRLTRRVSPERIVTIVVSGLVCAVAADVSGVVVVGTLGIVLALSQLLRVRWFRAETASTG